MNNNGNNGFGGDPIRKYKRQSQPNMLRTTAVLIMTAVLIVFVVIFIMSLTGTGMFADKKDGGSSSIPPGTDEGSDSGTQTDQPISSEDPNLIKYTFVDKNPTDIALGYLQLIDEDHLYLFKEESLLTDLYSYKSDSYQISRSDHKLKYQVVEALNDMMDDFVTATGYTYINVTTAYRDFDTQKGLHEQFPTSAVSAGASDHHSGATIQMSGWDASSQKSLSLSDSEQTKWLKENAHKYGFIFRSPSDKKSVVGYSIEWQIRYVGIPHAQYMYENNLCLEEYLEKLAADFTYSGEHLKVEASDGNVYEIYCVQGTNEGTLRLPVPENRPYTVSGDNIGGYIVTVTAGEADATE